MTGAGSSADPNSTPVSEQILARLAGPVAERKVRRVAIDGPDAAGKSTLAAELVPLLEARGLEVVAGTIDGFHRPPEERYRRRHDSAYLDSFDHEAVRVFVLGVSGAVSSIEQVRPRVRADVVLLNDDPARPHLLVN